MSIIERIRRIARANVHEVLDKAEAPDKMLKQTIRDLEETIKEAKQALADFAVSFKKMEKEQEQLKRRKDEWQQKAESSLKVGDEDMARKALGEKLKAEERIAGLEPSVTQSRATYNELKDNLGVLQDRLGAVKLKLSELQSRKQTAEAQTRFGAAFDKAASSGVGVDFARMEEEVLHTESEVEIDREIRGDMKDADSEIEKKSQALRVEADLDALKKRVKKQPGCV